MTSTRTPKEALSYCKLKGYILPLQETDKEFIISILELSNSDMEAGKKIMQGLDDTSLLWSNVYACFYDALHKLVDAYLRFDGVTSINHLCLYAYLCDKHPELELSWDFFEKIRTRRNGIHYYAQKSTKKDWKEAELQFYLYIKMMRKAVEEKIKN